MAHADPRIHGLSRCRADADALRQALMHAGIDADGENAKDGYRVNLGCVEGLDPLALEISIIDGKALPLIEAPG